MRWPRRGKLGAAVTDLPSAPLDGVWPRRAPAPPRPSTSQSPSDAAVEPAPVEPPSVMPAPRAAEQFVEPQFVEPQFVEPQHVEPQVVPAPVPAARDAEEPRVVLALCDGTTVELDPASDEARALDAFTSELVRIG